MTALPDAFVLREVAFTDPVAQRLVEEVQAEYVVRYGGPDETPLDPGVFDRPSGAFYVGWLDGDPVATGAWRHRTLDVTDVLGTTRCAEVKRMYVALRARRRGLARVVLAHLEAEAARAGAEAMVLETGTLQPEAVALYEAVGYRPVPPFGHYADAPESVYLGRPIGRPRTPRPDGPTGRSAP